MDNFKIDGLDELIDFVESMEISEQKERRALRASGEIIKKSMEDSIVEDSGYSKKSIKQSIKKLDDGLYSVVEVGSWYYPFEEYGTSQNKSNVGKIERNLQNAIEDAVEESKRILGFR